MRTFLAVVVLMVGVAGGCSQPAAATDQNGAMTEDQVTRIEKRLYDLCALSYQDHPASPIPQPGTKWSVPDPYGLSNACGSEP